MDEREKREMNPWQGPMRMGDVFQDHLWNETPNMKGQEVSEEEYEAWLVAEGFKK